MLTHILNLGAYKRKLGAQISETLFKCLIMRALKKMPFLWSSAEKTANIFVGLKFLFQKKVSTDVESSGGQKPGFMLTCFKLYEFLKHLPHSKQHCTAMPTLKISLFS